MREQIDDGKHRGDAHLNYRLEAAIVNFDRLILGDPSITGAQRAAFKKERDEAVALLASLQAGSSLDA